MAILIMAWAAPSKRCGHSHTPFSGVPCCVGGVGGHANFLGRIFHFLNFDSAAPWKFRTRLPNYRTNASPTRTDSGLPSGNSVATEFRVARQTHFIKLCHFLPIFRFFSTFLSIKYSKYKLQRTIHIPFRLPGRARFADANIYANVLPASPRFCQNVKNGVLPLFKFFEKNF